MEPLTDLAAHIRAHGVDVTSRELPADTPAVFDGLSIHLNEAIERTWRAYYLVHSFGSIAGWSADYHRVKAMFEELRAAKAEGDAARIEQALGPFRTFEEMSSRFSVWLLEQLGHATLIPDFTVFFRADLEAISLFHRTGKLPTWRDFLAEWRSDVESGIRTCAPFEPCAIPRFVPGRIDVQEVKQGL